MLMIAWWLTAGMASLHAQSHPVKFGKIDQSLLTMHVYEKDSGAAAVVIADIGNISFNYNASDGFSIDFDRHVRIKVLKKTGLKYADIEIPLYKNGEKIKGSIKGATYNLDQGQVAEAKLSKDQVFKQEVDDNYSLVKFTMPHVKEGSVIEYQYTVNSEYIFSLVTWEFQRGIPTLWSELRAHIPDYFSYKTSMDGYLPLTASHRESHMNHHGNVKINSYLWLLKDAPALQEEKFVTTMSDYTSKMQFELQTINFPGQYLKNISNTWEKLNEDLNKSDRFGKQIGKSKYLTPLVTDITAEATSPQEKARLITQYVRQNIQYNGQKRLYTSAQLKKILEEQKGNSADINLLLVSMLQEAGLTAYPVILSTRDNGRVHYTPMLQDFNYVVAYVNIGSETLLLDGTDPDLPFDMLPFYCLNKEGRLIAPQYTEWVPLTNQEKMSVSISGNFKLNIDGTLDGEFKSVENGYLASATRTKIREGEQQYLDYVRGNHSDWSINAYQNSHIDEVDQNLEETFTVALTTAATPAADKIYLQPMLAGAEKENPFKLEKREYPVDFGCPIEEKYMFQIELPDGYTLEEVPEQIKMNLPEQGGVFWYRVSPSINSVVIISTLSIKKPVFYAEEYASLRHFYNIMVAKHAEQIVLKKLTE